jgi:hypothetical protein
MTMKKSIVEIYQTADGDLTVGSGTVGIATAIVGEGRTFDGCEIKGGYCKGIGIARV